MKIGLEIVSVPRQVLWMKIIKLVLFFCLALISLAETSWSQKTPADLRRQAAVYERMAADAQAKADATTDPQQKAAYVRRATVAQGTADSLRQEADQLERAAK